jgi:hypothetical protein
MTPKEKAEELVMKFAKTHIIAVCNTKEKLISPYKNRYSSLIVRNNRAKQSALITVDEILAADMFMMTEEQEKYWEQVKEEIEKL